MWFWKITKKICGFGKSEKNMRLQKKAKKCGFDKWQRKNAALKITTKMRFWKSTEKKCGFRKMDGE